MAVGITPVRERTRSGSVAWPSLIEAALVAGVIGLLLPWFVPLATEEGGRDGRFSEAPPLVRGLPNPVLPELCAVYASAADASLRDRLCARAPAPAHIPRLDRVPPALTVALSRAQQALVASIAETSAQAELLDRRERGSDLDPARLPVAAHRRASAMDPAAATLTLDCLSEWLRDAFAGGSTSTGNAGETLRANAVLLAGAVLDARSPLPGGFDAAALPQPRAKSPACSGMDARARLVASAALIAEARSTRVNAVKDDAMRMLLRTARWQWAAWALLGLVLLNLHRSRVSPVLGVGLALASWAGVAWAFRVPWPLGAAHHFVLARPSLALTALPADFVLWMLAIAVALLAIAPWVAKRATDEPSVPASVFAYPGLVAATGIGWLVLLDLSANGNFGNRYLALYHQGHLWLGMLAFTVVAFLRQPIGRGLAWGLSLVDGITNRLTRRIGALGSATLLLPLALGITALFASVLANTPQVTSELGRLWLMIGAAWFFFMRGTPLTERLALGGNSLVSLARYTGPLVFVVIVLIAAMLMTHDMGPLLVAGYAAGAFIAASIAMWLYQRRGATLSAYAIAVVVFVGWIALTTLALFKLGAVDRVAAERLENASMPFASVNDQLALVTWFRHATPEWGFGPGAVPWCGFGATTSCPGVPAQIQSDYTFTALFGVFGGIVAWAITIGCAVWLYVSIRAHGAASRGEPGLVHVAGRVRNDEQSFLSWICVAWVVMALCQLAVTVAGNLAVIPLTGVTFPFISFGMTSLVGNMAMLGLAIDVGRRMRRHA